MKYLKFKNNGEIQLEAITLLGASTKRTDGNKIGFFGSGNKFAIAYLLRNGYDICLFAGNNELKVTTQPQRLGEEIFDVIHINNIPTSITTEFGAKWKLWQALRELYSNAIDEGGESIEVVDKIIPIEGETHYYILMRPELLDWFSNFNDYFSENKEVLFESKYGKILKKHNNLAHLYRKGIKVYESKDNSLYDYDFNDISITEDRIISYSWEISEKIWRIIYSCTNKDIIRNIFHNINQNNLIETNISGVSDIPTSGISDEVKEVLKEMKICNSNMGGYLSPEESLVFKQIPSKIFNSLSHLLTDDNLGNAFKVGLDGMMYRECEFTLLQEKTINKLRDFLKECNALYILEDYEIICGIFDNKTILGYADRKNNRIVISNTNLDEGVNEILNTIIEEYIHLKYNVKDCTREFQTSCITEMIKIMKIKNAYVL